MSPRNLPFSTSPVLWSTQAQDNWPDLVLFSVCFWFGFVNYGSRVWTSGLGLARQAHSGLSFPSRATVTILKKKKSQSFLSKSTRILFCKGSPELCRGPTKDSVPNALLKLCCFPIFMTQWERSFFVYFFFPSRAWSPVLRFVPLNPFTCGAILLFQLIFSFSFCFTIYKITEAWYTGEGCGIWASQRTCKATWMQIQICLTPKPFPL